jgi:hypothetical protein
MSTFTRFLCGVAMNSFRSDSKVEKSSIFLEETGN